MGKKIGTIRSFTDSETKLIYDGFFSRKLPADIQRHGDLAGYWSIRINDQFRVIFIFDEGGADHVQITDYP